MSLLDKAVEDSIRKRYIDAAEGERVKKSIKNISGKYRFPEEWLVKMILVEAEGFNAKRGGACVGVVQACQGESTLDKYIYSNGGYNWWRNLKPSQQIEAWGNHYLDYWIKTAKGRTPTSQGELMLINILPARYVDLARGRITADTPMKSRQASFLYTDYNPKTGRRTGGGYWSANSASRGMDIKTQQVLGNSVLGDLANATVNAANQVGSLAQDAASAISNGLATLSSGIQSALLTGQNCPPPPYTQQDRIIYPGCLQKAANPIFGNGLGSGASAPGVNSINNSQGGQNTVSNSEPYTGELKPGGFINPMKKGTYTVTSGFGWRWGRMHRGIDLGGKTGTPIYASADGVVQRVINSCPLDGYKGSSCGGGYGNQVILAHSNDSTLYAHLNSVNVANGQRVKQGQQIGTLGDSGSSTAEHLHFEVRINGKAVDPASRIRF